MRRVLLATGAVLLAVSVWAQVLGEEAEMERLRVKAEEAMANDDPEAAAMMMGRAALMASQLARRETAPAERSVLIGTEHLFRSQEHGYRALALYRRAGGRPPGSAGVCGTLQLGHQALEKAVTELGHPETVEQVKQTTRARLAELRGTADDWITVLSSMKAEFRCS